MPDWTPDWADVHFDRAAAHRAATECERAARFLRDTTQRRSALAESALADGRGAWRDQLVRRAARVDERCAEIEANLRALAAALRDASARAERDQLARVAARQRWIAQAKAEAELAAATAVTDPGQRVAPS